MEEKAQYEGRPVEALIKLLDNPDPKVRAQARQELCARGEEAIPKLVRALGTVYENVRFEIAKTLTEIGKPALKPMMEAILHSDTHVRCAAARVLSLIGGQEARTRLEQVARTEKRKTVRKELREASAAIARRLDSLEGKPPVRSLSGRAAAGMEDGLSAKEREEKTLYFNIVKNLILSNWARPELPAKEAESEGVLLTLKVERSGSVSRVLIENKWQDTPVGESLKDAIRRSSPFPPVPEVIAREKEEIDVTFILPVEFRAV